LGHGQQLASRGGEGYHDGDQSVERASRRTCGATLMRL
jgi:hypothetical protein